MACTLELPAGDAAAPVWATCDPVRAAVPACPAPPEVDTPDWPLDDDTDDAEEEEDGAEVLLPPVVELPAAAPNEDAPLEVIDVLDDPADDDPETFDITGPFDDAPLLVPAESPEPPACVVAEEEFASEWLVSARATPAPASTAAPTPTPTAPAVNQLDTGNTRPPSRPAVSLLC